MDEARDFERRVADHYRAMGARLVEHDVDVSGQQVDVYVEEETPSRQVMRTIVEVKHHKKSVGVVYARKADDVFRFLKQRDLVDRYVIVSRAGFTRPCREAARVAGILLLEEADLKSAVQRGPSSDGNIPLPREGELQRLREVIQRTSPPKFALNIRRPRVLEKLARARTVPVTMLVAPGGYGKSHLVSDFFELNSETSLWYAVSETEAEAPPLFHSLCTALEHRLLQEPSRVSEFIETYGEARDACRLMAAYFCYLSKRLDPHIHYFVILDDVYHIEDGSSGEELVREVVSLLPPNIHMILVARSQSSPTVGLDHIPHIMLDRDDLRFTKEEAIEFLQAAGPFSETDAEYLHERTEGWPLAIGLAVGMVRSTEPSSVRSIIGGRGGPGIAEHLLRESLDSLDAQAHELLALAAICPRFRPEMATSILGHRDSNSTMSSVEGIYSAVIFALGDGWYRLHDLFRTFLLESPAAATGARLRTLRIRAGKYFADSGEYFAAFDLFAAAGDHERNVDIFERLAEGMVNRSWILANYRWVESLSEARLENSPWLCLCRARVLEYRGQFEQANELAFKALESFRQGNDKHGRMLALYRIGKNLHQHKKDNTAKPFLEESLALAGELENHNMVAIVRVKLAALGRVLGHLERDRAIAVLVEMASEPSQVGAFAIGATVSHALGNCYRDVGRYAEAVGCYEESIRQKRELGDRYGIAKSLRNQAIARVQLGGLAEAEQGFREALKIQEGEIDDRPGVLRTLDSLGSCLVAQGRIEDAKSELTKAVQQRQEYEPHDLYGLAKSRVLLAEAHALGGDLKGAEEILTACEEYAAPGGSPWVIELLHRVKGFVCACQGDLGKALECLTVAVNLGTELGIRHRTDESRFKRASVLAAQGALQQSIEALSEAKDADGGQPTENRDYAGLSGLLRLKIEAAAGRHYEGAPDGTQFGLDRLTALGWELRGDISRLHLRLGEAGRHYEKALDNYVALSARERIWAVSAKLTQIRPSADFTLPDPLLGRMPNPREVFWLVL